MLYLSQAGRPPGRQNNKLTYADTLDGSPEVEGDGWSRIRTFDNLKAEYKDLDPAVTHNIVSHSIPLILAGVFTAQRGSLT